jgi:aspartyl-tRNA(Asn)/glutamyl-tRNA(Gln) amidotransferase subunit A
VTGLTEITIAEARTGLAAKQFSARELTEAHIVAMEAARPLNAYITETPEIALDMAAASDERLARGEARPLDGIPIAVKDLFCTKGVLTTAASHILDGFRPPYESTVTKPWQAKKVMLGKTNLDEFAMARRRRPAITARPIIRGVGPATTAHWWPAARPAARPRRSRPMPRSARRAPIPAARSASRRASAASSG